MEHTIKQHEKINYLEFPCRDLTATKRFFTGVFDWVFTDYGMEYSAFSNHAGIEGGFYQSLLTSKYDNGAALIVFYSDDLKNTENKIKQHGGTITKLTFSFPGGQRFHFAEPSGNEFAVWSNKKTD